MARDERGSRDLALKTLARGLRYFPRDAAIWDCLADTHRICQTSRVDAEASYLAFRRVALNENDEGAAASWASFGFMLEKCGNFRQAEVGYRQAVNIDPNYRWAIGKLSALLRRHIENYGESELLALRCVQLEPDNAWSWFNLGFLYHHCLHRFSDAKSAYEKTLEILPSYTAAWENLASLLAFQLNAPREAGEAFSKAFELGTNSVWTYNQYGHFLREFTDRYDEAENAFRKGISLNPEDWGNWLGMARLFEERLLQPSVAEEFYLEAKRLGGPTSDIDYRLARLSRRRPLFRIVE